MTHNTPSTQNNSTIEEMTSSEALEIGYVSKLFVQALFPYRSTEATSRQVQQGPQRITVTSNGGLPYGKYPRLIMAYLITQAVARSGQAKLGYMTHDQARVIPLGDSLNEFLRAIGLKTRGGGAVIANIREQIDKLASCSIKVENIALTSISTQRDAEPAMEISNKHGLWLPLDNDNHAEHPSFFSLTKKFYEEITQSPIPIDMNVLTQLGKPRAMDLYTWIVLKKFWVLRGNHKDHTFNWKIISAHFSPTEIKTSTQMRDFREEIKKCLQAIEAAWPDMNVDVSIEGVTIKEGPLAVSLKAKRQLTK